MYPKLIIDHKWRARAVAFEQQGHRVVYTDESGWESRLETLVICKMPLPVIIGDVSQSGASLSLLKVVEEALTELVCLASADTFDRVFLSRFVDVDKTPNIVANTGNTPAAVLSAVEKDDDDPSQRKDIWPILVKESPGMLPMTFYLRRSRLPAKMKVLGL